MWRPSVVESPATAQIATVYSSTHPRRRSSGVRRADVIISFSWTLFGLAVISYLPPRLYATWESTSTLTPPCRRRFRRPCRTALPHSIWSADTSVRFKAGDAVHGGVAGSAATWLWQCDTRRSPSLSAQQIAVRAQRCCTTCFLAE